MMPVSMGPPPRIAIGRAAGIVRATSELAAVSRPPGAAANPTAAFAGQGELSHERHGLDDQYWRRAAFHSDFCHYVFPDPASAAEAGEAAPGNGEEPAA